MSYRTEHEYTANDYRNDTPPRATGSETEYTLPISDDLPPVPIVFEGLG